MTSGIVLDSSALICLLLGEPESDAVMSAVLKAEERWVSAVNRLEAAVVISARKGIAGRIALDALLSHLRVETVPFTGDHAAVALTAWEEYGKGRHPAALNLGDCCAYSLSRLSRMPLLAKGDDFPRTDIPLVPL